MTRAVGVGRALRHERTRPTSGRPDYRRCARSDRQRKDASLLLRANPAANSLLLVDRWGRQRDLRAAFPFPCASACSAVADASNPGLCASTGLLVGFPARGESEVRGAARTETRFHSRTGITSVVPWLVVSESDSPAPIVCPGPACCFAMNRQWPFRAMCNRTAANRFGLSVGHYVT